MRSVMLILRRQMYWLHHQKGQICTSILVSIGATSFLVILSCNQSSDDIVVFLIQAGCCSIDNPAQGFGNMIDVKNVNWMSITLGQLLVAEVKFSGYDKIDHV